MALEAEATENVPLAAEFYTALAERGLAFGPDFQGVTGLLVSSDQALAEIRLPEGLAHDASFYTFHPALLDACLQPLSLLLPQDEEKLYLPVQIERMDLTKSQAAHCSAADASAQRVSRAVCA